MNKIFYNITLVLLLLLSSLSYSAVKVEISQGNIKPVPVVIIPVVSNSQDQQIALQISKVIINDLQSTDLFKIIDGNLFKEDSNINTAPVYENWVSSNANFIFKSTLTRTGNEYNISFKLYNALTKRAVNGFSYSFNTSQTNMIAHDIGDEIYNTVTGERGYFNTKLVFIDERGSELNRIKQIVTSDYNGENTTVITKTDAGSISITPRFSSDGRYIAYTVIRRLIGVDLYIYDVQRKTNFKLGNFSNMTFSPRFSPDNKFLLFSMSTGPSTNIYELNLATGKVVRLTNSQYIDVSPSYSPDGKYIVFSSDRTGKQQLYTMDRNGKNVTRISYGDRGFYATPSWSPRGDLIAYTRYFDDSFFIGVMSPNGENEKYLTKLYAGESPTWSPNGRRIVFYGSETRANYDKNKLFSIDITGIGRKPLPTPSGASDPDWSYQNIVISSKKKID